MHEDKRRSLDQLLEILAGINRLSDGAVSFGADHLNVNNLMRPRAHNRLHQKKNEWTMFMGM